MADLDIMQGEGKPLKLTYKNKITKQTADLTGAAMSFIVRSEPDGNEVIRKGDSDFNKALAGDGIITFSLSTEDTNIAPGLYYAQARAHSSSINSDLTDVYTIEIKKALFELDCGTSLLDGKVTVTV